MQPQPTQTRNSRWQPQDSSANNTQSDLSSMRSQNNKLKKSQESLKNAQNGQGLLPDENHAIINPHAAELANHKNQLIHPYQPQGKRRAESYNIRRREDAGGLEALDNELEYKIEGEAWQKDDDIEYQYIRSSNMQQSTKGHRREVRAPSSGSSGSQPRVVVAPSGKENGGSGCHLSVNSSGVQRRYDSIEHQRQSQIDRFLQSPQEQIANLMIQKLK